jgi:hypothetical protein
MSRSRAECGSGGRQRVKVRRGERSFLELTAEPSTLRAATLRPFLCATAERSTERVDIPILLRVWIWEFGQPKDEKRKAKLENENKTLRPKGLSYSSESNLGKRKANPSASGRGRPRPEGRDDSRQLFQRINEKKPTFVLQGNQGPLRVQSAVQEKKRRQDAGATDYRARSLGERGAACCAPLAFGYPEA